MGIPTKVWISLNFRTNLTDTGEETHYVNLSKLHISSIFGFLLHKCYLFFGKLHNFKFKNPTRVILMTKIISNLQLKPKGIPSEDLWPKLKGTNNFYLIEIVLIWLILLNPRFETQVMLIASYFLKKFTNYFIIAWYFCQKVLINSFIY